AKAKNNRPHPRPPHPPPRHLPSAITQPRRPHRRTRANIGRQQCRKDQPSAKPSPRDKEIARRTHTPRPKNAQRNHQNRVANEDKKVGHQDGSRSADSPAVTFADYV